MKQALNFLINVIVTLSIYIIIYLLLSLIALLFNISYKEAISEPQWFILYTIFIGWWTTTLATWTMWEKWFDSNI